MTSSRLKSPVGSPTSKPTLTSPTTRRPCQIGVLLRTDSPSVPLCTALISSCPASASSGDVLTRWPIRLVVGWASRMPWSSVITTNNASLTSVTARTRSSSGPPGSFAAAFATTTGSAATDFAMASARRPYWSVRVRLSRTLTSATPSPTTRTTTPICSSSTCLLNRIRGKSAHFGMAGNIPPAHGGALNEQNMHNAQLARRTSTSFTSAPRVLNVPSNVTGTT